MQNTLEIFNDRKAEIEFYFNIIKDMDSGDTKNQTSENKHLFKIMKSNFLLMLYNLIEACIVSGFTEIYGGLKSEKCSYNSVIQEIQKIWLKNKVNEIYGTQTPRSAYMKHIWEIINVVNSEAPVLLYKSSLDISGNLDARKIKGICDEHRIRYRLETDGERLEVIKKERNNLAHGDVSFSECARDLTISDLQKYKDEVILFLSGIIGGMEKYYNEKQYKKV